MKTSLIRSVTLALALSAGLGAGLAHAQTSDGTFAGTDIKNTANGSYLDPSTNSTATLDSNTVITTVLEKPGFDILYFNGNNDGLGNTTNVGNTYNTAPASATATLAAGSDFPTPYVIVNNGNTVQNITLTSDSSGVNAPTVAYYLDSDKDGFLSATEKTAGPINIATTTITLPYDNPTTTTLDEGLVYFIQVITLPNGAVPGSQYTATPVGAGQGFDTTTNAPVATKESTTVLGLQYTTVTVQTPLISKTNSSPASNGWADQTGDVITVGNSVYYYIRVFNNTDSVMTGAILKDSLSNTDNLKLTDGSIKCFSGGSVGTNRCSTTAPGIPAPTFNELKSPNSFALPDLAPNEFYEFYVTVTVTGPIVPSGTTITNTATITLKDGSTMSATDKDEIKQPPIPEDATNTVIKTTDTNVSLNPNISGKDDGSVVSFTITRLPQGTDNNAHGTLYFNGVTVTAGQVIPANQINLLTYTPDSNYVGNVSFQYKATDNDGLLSLQHKPVGGIPTNDGTATYTIPVQPAVGYGSLSCTTTAYGIFGTAPLVNLTINAIDSSGNVGDIIVSLPYTGTAALAISPDTKTLYVAGQDNILRSYNTINGVWTIIGSLPNAPTTRPVRMATDKNGTVYISSLDKIWVYDGINISSIKTLNFVNTTGLTPPPVSLTDSGTSGDFIVDDVGNLYLITNNSGVAANTGLIDVFRIQNISSSTPTITFVERLSDSGAKSVYAGFAALPGATYAITDGGRFTNFDLGSLAVNQVKDPVGSGNTASVSDLASCYYPTLQPKINSTKTVKDTTINSTTTANPGDTLEYTIKIHNEGNIAADGVTFQDLIPTGTTYVPNSTTTNSTPTADVGGAMPYTTTKAVQTLNAATGTNLVGTTKDVIITFKVTVNAGVTSVSNTGTLGYNDNSTGVLVPTTKPTNTVTIGSGAPKLEVTKKVDSAFLKVTPDSTTDTILAYSPTQMTYTVTVKNIGTLDATNVTVSDTLPSTVKYVSGATQDATNAQLVTWPTIGTLAIGTSKDLTVVVTPNITANLNQDKISNTASAVADTITTPVPSNPALTDIIYPKLSKTVQNISQGTAASSTAADGLPGQTLEYCLAYNNYSTVALPNYTITDFVPGNTTAKLDGYGAGLGIKLTRNPAAATNLTSDGGDADGGSLTTTGGTYSAGTLTVKLGSVAAGESGQACFQVTIN